MSNGVSLFGPYRVKICFRCNRHGGLVQKLHISRYLRKLSMLVSESRAKNQIDCTLVVRECLEHLFRLVGPNGRFIYAHRADRVDEQLDGYNMLRHCGTVWSM